MRNVIDAIKDIIYYRNISTVPDTQANNRINLEGLRLEEYIKTIFAGTYVLTDGTQIQETIKETFSAIQKNAYPDLILRGGDAIEIKKTETNPKRDLQLNSSYPHNKVTKTKTLARKLDRDADWDTRDLLYIVGHIPTNSRKIKSLFFFYGVDYCADKKVYEKIKKTVKANTAKAKDDDDSLVFDKTKEIAHISNVDPLSRTKLRVRGMWTMKSPFAAFERYYSSHNNSIFELIVIINNEKLKEFANYPDLVQLATTDSHLTINDIAIPDPNNEVNSITAKLIQYYI